MAHVLVVDDEPSLRETFETVLKLKGHTVTTAINGLDAWEILTTREGNFDRVISDNNMPELEGLELLRRVREDERFKELPFTLMTALPYLPDGQSLKDICEGLNATFYDKAGLRISKMIAELL